MGKEEREEGAGGHWDFYHELGAVMAVLSPRHSPGRQSLEGGLMLPAQLLVPCSLHWIMSDLQAD